MDGVYYSTNTWLAYSIGQHFYSGMHYVWCSPVFDHTGIASLDRTTPPSSSPAEIYYDLARDVARGDQHSAKICTNRLGILRGAGARKKAGRITTEQYTDIVGIVDLARVSDFRPLLYVIPHHGVRRAVKEVPICKRAHPLAIEYLIEDLARDRFDVIEWRSF